jgi:hypothetical protein
MDSKRSNLRTSDCGQLVEERRKLAYASLMLKLGIRLAAKVRGATGLLILVAALFNGTGCRPKTHIGNGGTPEQRELMQAFLEAHDKGDLQAEEALVNWEGVTAAYKAHFIEHELKDGLRLPILSIDVVNLPDIGMEHFQSYSSTPEKFLQVHYGGSRSDKANLYPIGKKDGRYYIVLQTGV